MTKIIQLTRNKETLVDDDMYQYLNQWKWYSDITRTGYAYACTGSKKNKIRMHRLITNAPVNKVVDHIDGNTLNNQRENLRICTNTENLRNQKSVHKNNKTGYKGVNIQGNRFLASIRVNGKSIYLGSFSTAEDAATAYNEAAKKYHSEYASLNEVKL